MHLPQREEYNTKMLSIKEKLTEVDSLLQNIVEEKRLSKNEVSLVKGTLDEQAAIIEILKEENLQFKEKLPQLQPLQREFLHYRQEASDTILTLNNKLNDTQLKVLDLEKKLIQFGVDIVLLESSKAKEIETLNQQWQEKLKISEDQSKQIIEEIIKKQCDVKRGYETVIHSLKEQIAHKEAEVAWCQLTMKERDTSIDKEISSLKKELGISTLKNQELLQQRLADVEKRANKMTRKCYKLQQDYEKKIEILKKEKDLQVQALQKYINCKAERDYTVKDNRVEDAVKELELRYRKIIINLHTAAQQQRSKDMKKIVSLETAVACGKTEMSEEICDLLSLL